MPDAVPQLLHGPYTPPRLQIGERTECLLRDRLVVVTSWTDAPISWPRCQPVGQRGGCGLLLAGDLVHAVRCESALAVGYWWGVSEGVVWRWRKALAVGRMDSEGSRLLIEAASLKGAAAVQEHEWTAKERRARRRKAIELDLGRHLPTGYHGPRWTKKQLALLGTMSDADVAAIVGRTVTAVRVRRTQLGIPKPDDGRKAR